MCVCDKMIFYCDLCPKTFSVKRSLIRHVDSKHKKIKVICSVCNKPFSRSDSLAHHVNTMHQARTEPKRKQKRAARVVRMKRQRKRLPPFEIPHPKMDKEIHSPAKSTDESMEIPQVSPSAMPALPAPFVQVFPDDLPEVHIKPEVQLTVEPCVIINGEGETPTTSKSEARSESGYIPSHMFEKQKRFNVADEIDYTVLDLMQQTAIESKDEDRMFLLSILSDFKRVPMEKKLKVKARIVGAIVDALD